MPVKYIARRVMRLGNVNKARKGLNKMKSKLRFTVIITLVLWLLVSVFPVAAGAIKTPITGVLSIVGVAPLPEYREWWPTSDIRQFRNILTYWVNVVDDPRLSGFSKTVVNGTEWYVDGVLYKEHVWGTTIIYSDQEYTMPSWECTYTGHFDVQGKAVDIVCKGVGIYEGLHAKESGFCPSLAYSIYDLQGEILEPGGK